MTMALEAILTTTVLFSGTVAVSSVAFEVLDDRDCTATARATLGGGMIKEGVEWTLETKNGRKTLVCVPYRKEHKDE